MVQLPDFFPGPPRRLTSEANAASVDARADNAQLEMGTALIFGLQLRNTRLRFIDHCARVAALVDRLAEVFSLDSAERSDLHAAAELHEIGMISVPAELIDTPDVLDEVALARLRSQASTGAEILRPTQSTRTCRLVEQQYTDFDELRLRYKPGSRDLLLAGILRAADVLDTVLHPRPYQADLDPDSTPQILRGGRGTSFHPQAVEALLQLQGIR